MGYGDKMHRCGKFVKYGLYISNLLLLFGGIAATVVGILALKEQSVFKKLVDDTLYESSANVLIGTGICIIIFVVPGCYGAVKETKCFLLLHMIVLLIFFVVLLIGGVLGYVFHGKESEIMETDMFLSMKNYNHSDSVQETWNSIQTQFHCCGINDYEDWIKALHGNEIPASCCKNREVIPHCLDHPIPEEIWTTGCLSKFKAGGNVVGSVSIVVSLLSGIGMAFTYGVFKSIT